MLMHVLGYVIDLGLQSLHVSVITQKSKRNLNQLHSQLIHILPALNMVEKTVKKLKYHMIQAMRHGLNIFSTNINMLNWKI